MSELTEIPGSFIQNIKLYHIIHNKHRFGSYSILFVSNYNQVYGLGDNSCGQLGLDHNFDVKTIQEVTALKDERIVQLSSKGECYFAVSHDNTLYSWGWNKHGQLGRPSENNHDYQPDKVNFNFPSAIKLIEVGRFSTLILLDNGKMFMLEKIKDTNTFANKYCRICLYNHFESKNYINFLHCPGDLILICHWI